ncbi:MAG: MarR family transcriptional regulator [Betaproteobacteria bacterium]|nr:MarR family transcriptional regulator [Betaproteobacteria bacterium]
MELTPITERFIVHWGEMGSRWGVNRTVAQIHALLYLTGRPMDAEEITDTLGVARSNVSTSLKELQGWRLVRLVHLRADRRDYFETSTDVWELFRLIVEGRRQREIDPTIATLRDCLNSPDLAKEDTGAQKRIQETLDFIETLTTWADEMLRLKPETLMKTLGVGAKISRSVRGKKPLAQTTLEPAENPPDDSAGAS